MKYICVTIAGSVDSGKSTLMGTLYTNKLDDGNGLIRNKVCRHKHEYKSGRTSDISVRVLKQDNKIIELVDLCGHFKYLKTTLFGITGYFPDYSIITIAANRGILPMTKEHLGILLYLKIPIIIIITKIDITPTNVYDETLLNINKIINKSVFKKKIINFDINKINNFLKYSSIINMNSKYIPIITISNKTGYNLDIVRNFILSLEPRVKWEKIQFGSVFYIESKFTPPGIGLILYGILNGQNLNVGDKIYIGPKNRDYIKATIWSIHDCNRNSIKYMEHGQRGCIALRINKKHFLSKKEIRRGMVVINDLNLIKHTCFEFEANINILKHSTTISNNYTPVIHCGIVRQAAEIQLINNIKIRTGDFACVKFKFIRNPEFLFENSTFFFREGKTRGVGIIKKIYSIL
jgi:elongation factor 1-alpha